MGNGAGKLGADASRKLQESKKTAKADCQIMDPGKAQFSRPLVHIAGHIFRTQT
jgi:hypothetical protein